MTKRIPADAFEVYVAMGNERSYQALAERFGVTKRAITRHATRERWSDRLDRIEDEARERSDAKLVDSLDEIRTRHMRMLKAMAARALSALKAYPLSSGMEAMRAAEAVIKLERLVAGEPTDRTAVSMETMIRREYERWLGDDEDSADADE